MPGQNVRHSGSMPDKVSGKAKATTKMAKMIGRLTALEVDSLPPRSTPYADGGNLYLDVQLSGARSWVFIFRWEGKQRTMGGGKAGRLGVSLKDARRWAAEGRALLDRQPPIDPRTIWRAPTKPSVLTFAEAAKSYRALHEHLWRNAEHARQWRSTVETYCKPLLKLPIDEIDTQAVLAVLTPIWPRIPETASRVRGRIETIIDFAKADDELRPNPARWRGHLAKKLPNPKLAGKHVTRDGVAVRVERDHLAALAYTDAPDFARRLRAEGGILARALELAVLTAARSDEVLGATWREVDFDSQTWTIPPERLKTGKKTRKPHVVPLSDRAIAVLEEARAVASSDFIFPSHIRGQPLRANALRMLLQQRMGFAGLTVHGFRSTFRDWCGDETNFPREVAEQALGHAVGGVEGAYRRGDALSRRRLLMNAWADYCGSPPGDNAGNVVPLKARVV
jgi:integrase